MHKASMSRWEWVFVLVFFLQAVVTYAVLTSDDFMEFLVVLFYSK